MRKLLRDNLAFFLPAALVGAALRLFFIFRFPVVVTDSFVYGDIAKNWLVHGIYGLSGPHGISPTDIRLPGYPAFLAGLWLLSGMEHYRVVLFVQLFVDLGTCLLIADIARRIMSGRAAKVAFLLAALCPFLANYAAAALSETWEIFFTAAALDCAIAGACWLSDRRMLPWAGCGLACAGAILIRPDGGLVLAAMGLLWVVLFVGASAKRPEVTPHIFRAGCVVAILSLAPLIPWTWRNLHTLHIFQPLAPRYANQPDEYVPAGFHRWVKTWMADYTSVEEVYWQVPGDKLDPDLLPARACDSEAQCDATSDLIDEYNQKTEIPPVLDARFAALADARIHAGPFRYYVWLPLVRVADMWLRPRTEMLPSSSRWWEMDDASKIWLAVSFILGFINLFYVVAAIFGLIHGRPIPYLWFLLAFVLLRSAFLGTLENPEPRYTLECYPVVIVLAAAAFANRRRIKRA